MRVFSLATMALVGVAQMTHAQDYSPEEVTAAVLTGFIQQDLGRIAQHSNIENQQVFNELVTGELSVSEFFEDAEAQAAMAWDGMILPARYAEMQAIVPFSIEANAGPAALGSGLGGRYIVITLELDGPDDATWGLEDINYLRRDQYNTMADTRP